jgi:hypothetical protein
MDGVPSGILGDSLMPPFRGVMAHAFRAMAPSFCVMAHAFRAMAPFYCVMAGLGPATHDSRCEERKSRGWPGQARP